jgi:hypothetical protein
MDEQITSDKQKPRFDLRLLGRATVLTKGSTTLYPWFETSPPPFDRRCLSC